MIAVSNVRSTPLTRGRAKKNLNALTACIIAIAAVAVWVHWVPITAKGCVLGFLASLVLANAGEYLYHRFLSHAPGTIFAKGHMFHHGTQGTPDEPEHISFGGSVGVMIILFIVNALPFALADLYFHFGAAPGYFLGLIAYFIATEEIHWRIHLGGWLPSMLRTSREYHLLHHDQPNSRFNIFLPLFDVFFGTLKNPRRA